MRRFWSILGQEEDNMAIVEKMVADVDLDSNGEISFDEFCTMMDSRWSDVGKGGKRIEMKRLGCLTVLSV